MKRFSEQFKKQSENIHMRVPEKAQLRERVVSYMEYHPMAKTAKVASVPSEVIVSEPFKVITFNKIYFRSFAGAFAMLFIIGVPFVAERAVPGDVLYPVKVEFNEELRSTLALSPYAKVAWETQRLERRISEARLLASEGKLTQEAETKVAEAVKTHTDAAQREIATIRESDSDEAAIAEIAFASALAVQSEVLKGHIQKDTQELDTVETGRSVVALAEVVAQARSLAEASQTGSALSYEKLLGRVEWESTRIYELFTSVKKDASTNEVANVERRLEDIERKITEAIALKEGTTVVDSTEMTARAMTMARRVPTEEVIQTEVVATSSSEEITEAVTEEVAVSTEETTKAEKEAIRILRSALTDIQKLLNYLTHIDVRQNVSIEDLVPVIPTIEEQVAEVMRLLNETLALQAQIGAKDINQKLALKVSNGQESIEINVTAAVAAMEVGDVEGAQALLIEAHAFATELTALTAQEPDKALVELTPQKSTTTQEETE